MREIKIITKPQSRKIYHSILRSNWEGESTYLSSLDLVRRVLYDSGCNIDLVWESKPNKDNYIITQETSDALRKSLSWFHYDKKWTKLPSLPHRRNEQAIKLSQSALEVSILVNFQYIAKIQFDFIIDDEDEFLRNCQSLLFTLVVCDLLPILHSNRLIEEHQFLIDALYMHATLIWRDEPVHYSHLLGLLGSYIRDGKLSRKAFEFSFSATGPNEHDYLTKAHTLWYHYLDSEDFDHAKEFVLSLHRSSPVDCLPEIEEMLEDTYAYFNQWKESKRK